MSERPRDRWVSILLAVLLHGLIAATFVYGWMLWRRPPPPLQAVAIDATVVDSRSLGRVTRAAVVPTPPAPEPEAPPAPLPTPPPTPIPTPSPEPTPAPAPAPAPAPQPPAPPRATPPAAVPAKPSAAEQRARREAEAAKEAAKEAARRASEKVAADAAQKAAEKAAAEKAAAEKAAAEKAAAARAAAEKAAAEQKAREAQDRAAKEADLKRHLAEEERVAAAQASGLQDRWVAQIQARIERAWIRPASARPGLDCTVLVTQVPGGEVVSAKVANCNGDEAVRQSIEAAVIRASPLPAPPDPALFVRNLEILFRPRD